MAKELAFALINPYTIGKSRTGGVIARYIARTGLRLVAARMFGPSHELVRRYSELIRQADPESRTCGLIADYVLRSYSPEPSSGKPRRVMMLLFEGEDALRRIWEITGSATTQSLTGQTIRDTFGDYFRDADGQVSYFEPAVLASPSLQRASASLNLWAEYSASCGGLMDGAYDVPHGEGVQRTLVLLKPDNFKVPSARPGNIIDILSSSGLRIIGAKKFSMTVAQAEEFYGPVRRSLQAKFPEFGMARAAGVLSREFGFEVPIPAIQAAAGELASLFAAQQFDSIVHFMTGYRPSECLPSEKPFLGKEECLALVYQGVGAVATIRRLLGPTDPSKAEPGSVRREYGSSIMVNAIHASDSQENADRELKIIKVEEETIGYWVNRYYRRNPPEVKPAGEQSQETTVADGTKSGQDQTLLPGARVRCSRGLRNGAPRARNRRLPGRRILQRSKG